ncbi:glycosyltransferase family 2 protein [Lacibacter sediminis]|uniref:Glycosyltransferase n=1 Tax=Lacibacter sediminis TaxID=2760713 RepID=A0A7G5XHN6_9BACT|nr:glycosyltransferase family 2 protein [Lacibacter sediminis]QNA44989.1 glycosyltransferase [Lacibacter sediminis]
MSNYPANNCLLSIIMPVYNAGQYIETVLQSIALQTFSNYELVVLDALSTDGTKEIVEARQKEDQRVRLISEKDNGIYDAMNKGVASAKGEWVYFMGCDDGFYDASVLERLFYSLTEEYDLVYGDVLWVPDEVIEKGTCMPTDLINRNINHQRIFYRRTLFQQYGGYDLQYRIASDHELNIRFFCSTAIRKKYVPYTVARYHSGGFSANKVDEVFWNNWKEIFKKNFAQHLPAKIMYDKLGWYCRCLIDQQQYAKAAPIFFDVLVHTLSPGFVKLTMEQYFKSRKLHAG